MRTQNQMQTKPVKKSLQDIHTDKGLRIEDSMGFFPQKFFECPEENSSVSTALALVLLLVPQQAQ